MPYIVDAASTASSITWDGALVGAILVLVGSFELIYGFRFIRITMAAMGFLLFSSIASVVVIAIDSREAKAAVNTWEYVLIWAASGALGGVVAYFLWHVGIVMIGAFAGFALTSFILTVSGDPQFLALHIALPVVLNIAGVILAIKWPRPTVIVATSLGGALAFTSGLASLFAVKGGFGTTILGYVNGRVMAGEIDTSNLQSASYIILLVITLVAAIAGAAWQFGYHLEPSAKKWIGDHLGRIRYNEKRQGLVKTILGLNPSTTEIDLEKAAVYDSLEVTKEPDVNVRAFMDTDRDTTVRSLRSYIDTANWWTVRKPTLPKEDHEERAASPMLQGTPKGLKSPLTTMPNRTPITPPTALYDGVASTPTPTRHPRVGSLASVYHDARDNDKHYHRGHDEVSDSESDDDNEPLDYGSIQERYAKRAPLPDFEEADLGEEAINPSRPVLVQNTLASNTSSRYDENTYDKQLNKSARYTDDTYDKQPKITRAKLAKQVSDPFTDEMGRPERQLKRQGSVSAAVARFESLSSKGSNGSLRSVGEESPRSSKRKGWFKR